MGWVCGAHVPSSDQVLANRCTKMYGRATRSILHHVDTYEPLVGKVIPIPNHDVLLAWLNDQIFGCEVDVGTHGYDPSGTEDSVVVSSLIVDSL